jgi:outer membrane protein
MRRRKVATRVIAAQAPVARVMALLAVLVFVSLPAAALAETLADAWRLALARDHTLAAARSDVQSAQASERAARGARWPSVQANGGYDRLNAAPELDVSTPGGAFRSGPLFKDDQFFMGSIEVKLPLYTGGAISSGTEAARAAVAGARDQEQATSADLKLAVAQAYVDVLRARRSLSNTESSVSALAAHAGDVGNMVERQLVSRSDLLAARVALANAQEEKVRAGNAVALALAAYNRYLGEPLDRAPQLDDRLSVDPELDGRPLATLIQIALATRSELKGLAAQADQLAARSRAERGALLPQVALTGGYTHFDNQILDRENFATVGVGFTWSLFDGGQARGRADALARESHADEQRLEDLRSRIELQVRQAWLDVGAAQARVVASRAAVAQADENLRMSRELYSVGMATNTQVLDAVALRVDAVSNRDNAVLDEALARVQLAYSVGIL